MNLFLKSAVSAALLSAASVPAFATSVTPPASGPTPVPGLTNGGVVLEVYDVATGKSLTEWLGGDTGTLGAPGAVPAGGFTFDYGIPGGAATFNSLFSATDVSGGNVIFTVSSVNDTSPSTPIVDLTLSKIGTILGSALVAVGSSANTGVASIMNGATACNNVNPCTATSTGAPGYAVNHFGAQLGGLAATSSAGGVVGGSAVNFYQIVGVSGTLTKQTPVVFANAAGTATWSVSSTGDVVYSAPGGSAVPLPAAVWLLGSGLLGLAGIGRRKMLAA